MLPAYSIRETWLAPWHQRMAHLGEDALKKLITMSTGMKPIPKACLCLACVKSRLKENPHNTPSRSGEYPLEFIHMDLHGPLPCVGHQDARYWTILVDDLTGYTGIIPLRTKWELPEALETWLNKHERPERRCHRIRLDQAGENNSLEFIRRCSSRGIELEYTGTDQHQQNGIAEVTNRLVKERTQAVLIQSQLPQKCWPFIAEAVVYLRNRSPHSRHDKTPYESWWGDKPDLSHIRSLGCICYAKATGYRQKMVDNKAVECRLLGYRGSHIYVLLKMNGSIILSSNVVFNEKFCNSADCEPADNPKQPVSEPAVQPYPTTTPLPVTSHQATIQPPTVTAIRGESIITCPSLPAITSTRPIEPPTSQPGTPESPSQFNESALSNSGPPTTQFLDTRPSTPEPTAQDANKITLEAPGTSPLSLPSPRH